MSKTTNSFAAVCVASAMAAICSVPALADTHTELQARDYLSILGTYTVADTDRSAVKNYPSHASGLTLLYGHMFDDSRWGYEAGFTYDDYETGKVTAVDFYRYGLDADLTYSFGDRTGFTPFALIGVGADYNDALPDSRDGMAWTANAGVGFVTGPFTQVGQLRVRGEARYMYDSFESGYGEPRISLGIELPLFAEREVQVPPSAAQTQVVEVPTGLLDTDGDGVVDDKDKCPDTPAGTRVDGDGCPIPKIISLKGVTFETGKTRLRPDAKTILDLAVEKLKKYPDMQVEVAGHTDSVGSEDYNQRLSEGRAQAVKDYFVAHGVPDSQMNVKGYGETEPLDSNRTEEGREVNRRVEIKVLN